MRAFTMSSSTIEASDNVYLPWLIILWDSISWSNNWQNDGAIMNFEKVMKWLYNCCNYISVLWKVSPSANKTGVWLPSDFLLLFCRIVCPCKTNIYICLENLNSWTLNVGISFSFLFFFSFSLSDQMKLNSWRDIHVWYAVVFISVTK